MAERKGDCNRKFRSILAFFPVVAISSNLSTQKYPCKGNKNPPIKKASSNKKYRLLSPISRAFPLTPVLSPGICGGNASGRFCSLSLLACCQASEDFLEVAFLFLQRKYRKVIGDSKREDYRSQILFSRGFNTPAVSADMSDRHCPGGCSDVFFPDRLIKLNLYCLDAIFDL